MTLPHRLIPVVLAIGVALASCRRQTTLVVPEGEYRDGQGLATITITVMGRNMDVLLEANLAGRKITAAGRLHVYADGHLTINPVAANQHHAVFSRLDWRWEADHFVVKELDPPGRTLELKRR